MEILGRIADQIPEFGWNKIRRHPGIVRVNKRNKFWELAAGLRTLCQALHQSLAVLPVTLAIFLPPVRFRNQITQILFQYKLQYRVLYILIIHVIWWYWHLRFLTVIYFIFLGITLSVRVTFACEISHWDGRVAWRPVSNLQKLPCRNYDLEIFVFRKKNGFLVIKTSICFSSKIKIRKCYLVIAR